jgi:hypothetical protein
VTAATWVLYNILFIRYFDQKEAPAAVALLALAGPLGCSSATASAVC